MNLAKSMWVAAASAAVVVSLSGCSMLYPHWGATSFPTDSASASASNAPVPTASASTTPSTVPVQAANVNLMNVNVNATSGVIDVVAQITNVAENGGQCILTVTSGTTSKQQTVRAESNVDTTQCFPMEIPLTGLAVGTASVTVTYKSPAYVGSSAAQAVTIP